MNELENQIPAQDCELEYWLHQAENYAEVQIPADDLRAIIARTYAAVNALPELLALKQFVQANFYTKPDGGIYPMWHDWADYSEKVEPEISAFVRAALNQETKP